MAQPKPYNYYIGPWVWQSSDQGGECWIPPDGTVGLIDLRSLAGMGKRGGVPDGYGFFAVDGTLSAPYVSLGYGYIATLPVSNPTKNAINSYLGYKPSGSTLLEVIWDILTNGGDPTGELRLKPLIPTMEGNLELHLGGHSLIKSEKFIYGVHSHTEKVRAVIQHDYREIRRECIAAGKNHYLKFLDALGEKYNVSKPQDEFIPNDLPKESPLTHSTVITDNFNRADSDSLGSSSEGWSWTADETYIDLDIASNRLAVIAVDPNYNYGSGRAESDLSGTDQYAQLSITGYSTTTSTNTSYHAGGGPAVRYASAASTFYCGMYMDTNSDTYKIYKCVTGTYTSLASEAATFPATPFTAKITANGTSIDFLISDSSVASVTDSSISTGTRTGFAYYKGKWSGTDTADDFEAGDLGTTPSVSEISREIEFITWN